MKNEMLMFAITGPDGEPFYVPAPTYANAVERWTVFLVNESDGELVRDDIEQPTSVVLLDGTVVMP